MRCVAYSRTDFQQALQRMPCRCIEPFIASTS
jgi:hypothetical protein